MIASLIRYAANVTFAVAANIAWAKGGGAMAVWVGACWVAAVLVRLRFDADKEYLRDLDQ